MEDKYGINKAALGIRYLLKYLENGRIENFDVVKNCINELELWCLITHFSNNISEFYDNIPDYILEDIFRMKPVGEFNSTELFGKGFKSNSDLTYKEQFRLIRNSLSHSKFYYSNGIINIKDSDYEATFDLLWLEKLVGTTLKNDHFDFRKGMSDFVVMTVVDPFACKNVEFKELCDHGLVHLTKITSLTNNSETIMDILRIKDIKEFPKEKFSFNFLVEFVQTLIQQCELNFYAKPRDNLSKLDDYCKKLEKNFRNKVKIERYPLVINDKLLNNENFKELNLFDKCNYLLVYNKCVNSPTSYNFEVINNLLVLCEQIKCNKFGKLQLFLLKDATNFFLKVYANIFFSTVFDRNSYDVVSKYNVECSYINGSKVYNEYLKLLRKNYDDCKKFNSPEFILNSVISDMDDYSKLLEQVLNNEVTKNFNWKMRNSIMHNHIEFDGENVRFFTTGNRLHIWKYNRKNGTWDKKEYVNTKPIWEMITTREDLLQMLDELYIKNGFEIKVNISKYIKRKNYLK